MSQFEKCPFDTFNNLEDILNKINPFRCSSIKYGCFS